jgi:hypothetical protein
MGKVWDGIARRGRSLLLAAVMIGGSSLSVARGCTIFVLTDGERTLFFNNEDWSNPVSRVWFVPAPEGFYSCAYVGFENNGAEGGMNSAGLAFDWVAGFSETWTPYASMQPVGGRTSERMLETCATVEEAIAFYEKYREPQFHRAKILVADKSGASAIIGARNGRLQVDRANHSRGFGYGRATLATMLKTNTEPRLEVGREILRACEQKGQYATKYSSIFDLKNGEIMIVAAGSDDVVKIDFLTELKRGAHYYDIPKIRTELEAAPKPALSNMRSFLREYTRVENADAELSKTLLAVMQRAAAGKLRRSDFTPEFWKTIEPIKEAIRADLKPFGELLRVVAVENADAPAQKNLYKLEFKNAWVLSHFEFDPKRKISSLGTRGTEWKHPPAGAREVKLISQQ